MYKKKIYSILAIIGIILVVYGILGRFIGAQTIGLGIIKVKAMSAAILGNSFMLAALIVKFWEK